MLIMVLEKVSASTRGELSRWLIEPSPGVFIGKASATVREKLWKKCTEKAVEGRVFQAWGVNNEQGFSIRTHGDTKRRVVEVEGLQLVKTL